MARISEVKSLPESSRNRRRRLIDGGLLIEVGSSYELTEDYLFDSPSGAADVLLGRSANGRAEWKDPQGVSLKDNQAKRTGTFS